MTDNESGIRRLSDEDLAEKYLLGVAGNSPDEWRVIQEEFDARGGVVESGGVDVSGPLVTVFSSGDNVAFLTAKSLLESQGIPFVAKGDLVQDLIGYGRLFGGTNYVTGPAQLQVAESHAEIAREILEEIS